METFCFPLNFFKVQNIKKNLNLLILYILFKYPRFYSNMSCKVTVNFNGSSFGVRFQPAWSVAQLKDEIARKRNVSSRGIKIIFAGQELPDSLTLQVS